MSLIDHSRDVALIRAAQDHDLGAFAALVQKHHAGVWACLAVRMDSRHDAEDLAQEVFLTAFRKIDSCDPERPMAPWLRGIAMNLLANYRRKFRAIPVGLHEELQTVLDAEVAGQFENAGEGEMLDALRECLSLVDGPSRALLNARYADGCSIEELARQLHKRPSALSMQLHRLRVVLGDCIASKVPDSVAVYPSTPTASPSPSPSS
ncbi:sigma-70 family RNA polymerase sigma factor [Phragmitibacter flavus]|uniref:RNA polymerase sigma factor n=1 Tax=Phragmitibacter flavus TaxID=2576071 RepID=A0A5R8K990_9BACT|nr:sigma-70 family RNA polymerase sigma factor [Phragmitibacter flavus]TLD68886.1 sigma-70 family RNA polymerase sigma factor [Phragmitibacter flavus]